MSKVTFEYELHLGLFARDCTATQVKYRIRSVSAWLNKKIEFGRRELVQEHYTEEGSVWKFSDTGDLLDQEQTDILNAQLNKQQYGVTDEGTGDQAAVGVSAGTWYKEG